MDTSIKLNETVNYDGLEEHQKIFYHWIVEREKARVGRETGLPKPWTTDPVIQSYRFCNVRREDDTVTKWIHKEWLYPFQKVERMRQVLAMIIARTINRVETLQAIGYPLTDLTEYFEYARNILKNRRAAGQKVWTGAYLVSTNGHSMDKIDYIIDRVWKPFARKGRAPYISETLEMYHTYLTKFDGMGSFMAGQVIADLKYSNLLNEAKDWDTWGPIGPGSKRGLNRYFGRSLEATIKTKAVLEELNALKLQVHQRCGLHLPVHNIQNVCCEYDKMLRVINGEGTPRSSYSGK